MDFGALINSGNPTLPNPDAHVPEQDEQKEQVVNPESSGHLSDTNSVKSLNVAVPTGIIVYKKNSPTATIVSKTEYDKLLQEFETLKKEYQKSKQNFASCSESWRKINQENEALRNDISQYKEAIQDHEKKQNEYDDLYGKVERVEAQHRNTVLKLKKEARHFELEIKTKTSECDQEMKSLKKIYEAKEERYNSEIELYKEKLRGFEEIKDGDDAKEKETIQTISKKYEDVHKNLNRELQEIQNAMKNAQMLREENMTQLNTNFKEYKTSTEKEIQILQERMDELQVDVVLSVELRGANRTAPTMPAPLVPTETLAVTKDGFVHQRDSSQASLHSNTTGSQPSTKGEEKVEELPGRRSIISKIFSRSSPANEDDPASFPKASKSVEPPGNSKMSAEKTQGASSSSVFEFMKRKWQTRGAHSSANSGTNTPQGLKKNSYANFPAMNKRESVRSVGSGFFDNLSDAGSEISSIAESMTSEQIAQFIDSKNQETYSGSPRGSNSTLLTNGTDVEAIKLQRLKMLMHESDKAKLAEDLKMAHQKNSAIKETAKKKIRELNKKIEIARKRFKELQESFQLEKQQWLSIKNKYEQMIRNLKSNNPDLVSNIAQEEQYRQQIQYLQNQIQVMSVNASKESMAAMTKLQQQNQILMGRCQEYQNDVTKMKRSLVSSDQTMKTQQSEITHLKKKVSALEYEIKTQMKLSGAAAGGEKTNKEELLENQVKLMKKQRRTLIHEVKDLREQNNQLKNLIANGNG